MSEIDHDAAKEWATKIIKANEWLESNGFGKLSGGNISRAYLDLSAQLAAERARVEALAGLVKDQEMYDEGWANPIKKQLDAILEGRAAQGDDA